MTVHIITHEHPLCGFTGEAPRYWARDQQWVYPEEAHYATCQGCIHELHNCDELEASVTPDHPWPRR